MSQNTARMKLQAGQVVPALSFLVISRVTLIRTSQQA